VALINGAENRTADGTDDFLVTFSEPPKNNFFLFAQNQNCSNFSFY
jgi:hypothetical protein